MRWKVWSVARIINSSSRGKQFELNKNGHDWREMLSQMSVIDCLGLLVAIRVQGWHSWVYIRWCWRVLQRSFASGGALGRAKAAKLWAGGAGFLRWNIGNVKVTWKFQILVTGLYSFTSDVQAAWNYYRLILFQLAVKSKTGSTKIKCIWVQSSGNWEFQVHRTGWYVSAHDRKTR